MFHEIEPFGSDHNLVMIGVDDAQLEYDGNIQSYVIKSPP